MLSPPGAGAVGKEFHCTSRSSFLTSDTVLLHDLSTPSSPHDCSSGFTSWVNSEHHRAGGWNIQPPQPICILKSVKHLLRLSVQINSAHDLHTFMGPVFPLKSQQNQTWLCVCFCLIWIKKGGRSWRQARSSLDTAQNHLLSAAFLLGILSLQRRSCKCEQMN